MLKVTLAVSVSVAPLSSSTSSAAVPAKSSPDVISKSASVELMPSKSHSKVIGSPSGSKEPLPSS